MSFFKTRSKYLQQLIYYKIQQNNPTLSFAIQKKQNNIVIYYLYDYFFKKTIIPNNMIIKNIIWEDKKLISNLEWDDLFFISKNIIKLDSFVDLNRILKKNFFLFKEYKKAPD